MSKRTVAYLYLMAATVIWGFASPVIKFTLEGIDPFPFLAYRFSISMIIGVLILAIARPKIKNAKFTLVSSSLHGFLGYTLALSLLFLGLKNSTVLDLSLIGTVSPLVILFGGFYFFKDKITNKEKLGTLLALSGTLITVLVPAIRQNELKLTGNLLLFGFLFADAGAMLATKYLLKRKVPAIVLSNIGLITAGVSFLIIMSLTEGLSELIYIIFLLPLKYHLGVWYMAVLSGTVAYFCMIRGTKEIEVSEAGLFYYLQPIFTIPAAVLWLGEPITPTFILGAIFISIGVFIAEYRRSRRKRNK